MTDAHSFTLDLGGKWMGRYGMVRCPVHDDRRPSLSVRNDDNGNLRFHCFTGCDYRDVRDAFRQRGLLDGQGWPHRADPAANVRRQREEAEVHNARRRRQALDLWRRGQPITGTPAERYVRGRGITCALPDPIRYVKDCWHLSAKRLPALVAPIVTPDGAITSVQRIYLSADGTGKARVDPNKAMLGQPAGGAVHLSDAPGPLVVAEGIETALSLLCGLTPQPASVWAALSTVGMKALRLPPKPGELVIALDADPPGWRAAEALARRAHDLGWRVSMLPPPDGFDWNDVLTGKAVAA